MKKRLLAIAATCWLIPAAALPFDMQGYTRPPPGTPSRGIPPGAALNAVKGLAGVLAARKGLKAALFCKSHPLLCTGGVVAGLAAGGVAINQLAQQQNNPQPNCPPVVPENEGMSDESREYQRFITGLPDNTTIWLDGTKFDGCRNSDGTLLEAKGKYDHLLLSNGKGLMPWVKGDVNLQQAIVQANIARVRGRMLEWHFRQAKSYAYWKRELAQNPLTMNIIVLHTPMP